MTLTSVILTESQRDLIARNRARALERLRLKKRLQTTTLPVVVDIDWDQAANAFFDGYSYFSVFICYLLIDHDDKEDSGGPGCFPTTTVHGTD